VDGLCQTLIKFKIQGILVELIGILTPPVITGVVLLVEDPTLADLI
jgi:hypothetical protein